MPPGGLWELEGRDRDVGVWRGVGGAHMPPGPPKAKPSFGEASKLGSLNGPKTSLGISWGSPYDSRPPVPREEPAAPGVTCGRDDGAVGRTLLPPGGKDCYFSWSSSPCSSVSAKTKSGDGWMQTPGSGDRGQREAPDGKMHTPRMWRASAHLPPAPHIGCSSLLELL